MGRLRDKCGYAVYTIGKFPDDQKPGLCDRGEPGMLSSGNQGLRRFVLHLRADIFKVFSRFTQNFGSPKIAVDDGSQIKTRR